MENSTLKLEEGDKKPLPNIDIRLPIDDVDGIEEW